jgi:hypothetical protein
MNSATVSALADFLQRCDEQWRKAKGYTGKSVHCRDYWRNMAASILQGSVRALSEKPNVERTCADD